MMSIAQRFITLSFILGCIVGAAVKCFALDIFIKTLGADQLGTYYALAAIVSISLILFSIYLSKKIGPLQRFIGTHIIQLTLATSCFLAPTQALQAQIAFIAVLGFSVISVFANWTAVNLFVSTFEAKRLYPRISLATQIGFFVGSLLAMSSKLGLQKIHYLSTWLGIELCLVLIGFYLLIKSKRDKKTTLPFGAKTQLVKKREVNAFQLLRHYRLIPHLTIWVFIWGLVDTAIATQVGATFDRSGINLTLLYGILSLAGAIVGILSSSILYPRAVRWLGVGTILFASSLVAFFTSSLYLLFDFMVLGVAIYLIFKMLKGGFAGTALSTEFGLYPSVERDRIRLIGDLLASSAGASCVGFLFWLPETIVPWALLLILIILLTIGYLSKKKYTHELLHFLSSSDEEEQNNAIALFDLLDHHEGYTRMLQILRESRDLPPRINVLDTFSSLGTTKPASTITKLLCESTEDPLRIAILRYFSNVNVKQLDPFVRHQLFQSLREISKSQASNTLRAMAVKLWIQAGPVEETVGFIIERLRDPDERIIANAIEGLNYVNYPGALDLLLPYLKHKTPRVCANAIVAMWKYEEIRSEVQKTLTAMVHARDTGVVISGIWAAGEVNDRNQVDYLVGKIDDSDKGLKRGIPIALLKLGYEEYADRVAHMIVADDEAQAINMCYLSLRVEERILNERIIAGIFARGEAAREVAIRRYARCGGFCRDQIKLLSGENLNLSVAQLD